MTAQSAEPRLRFADLAEETTGFGEVEWRTYRDLLVRPRAALESYLTLGPTGGQRYARPFGFYMAMCGILMFYLFLAGGLKNVVEAQPPRSLDAWIAASGKSRQDFMNDVDSWMSLVVTPLIAIANALLTAPLLKWWSGLDWRRSFRSTYVLMCAWTAPVLWLGPAPQTSGLELFSAIFMWGAFAVAFLRMGRGLWFERWGSGALKCVALMVVLLLAGWLGMIPSLYIGMLGGMWGR